MIYKPQRDQVEKKEKFDTKREPIFDGHIHLASFHFACLVLSECCRRLKKKTYAMGKLEQPTNTTGHFLTESDMVHSYNKPLDLGCRSSLRRESRKI